MVKLSDELLTRVQRHCETDLLASADALLALDELKGQCAIILGADSFRLVPDGLAVGEVVDVSPGGTGDERYDIVRNFINQQSSDCWIELVWAD